MVQDIKNAMRQDIDAARLDEPRDQEARRWPSCHAHRRTASAIRTSGVITQRVEVDARRCAREPAAPTPSNASELDKIGKPVDRNEWSMTPPTVNAYYSPDRNNINFPAGILQPPFYRPRRDAAVNYGGAGAVDRPRADHGFDDQGRKFDGEGNLRDWWTPADAKAYDDVPPASRISTPATSCRRYAASTAG